MPSKYLDSDEYRLYGVSKNTTEGQVVQASLLVDTYLRRPEGLEYVPDTNGNPLYMAGLTATQTFRVPAGFGPGSMVTVTMTGPLGTLSHGGVLVVNKGAATAETLVIWSIQNNLVTFMRVLNTHTGTEPLDYGLTILETKQLPSNRPLMMLTRNPIVALLQGQGRYGYGRRGGNNNYTLNEFNLLAVMTQFGGPPVWENIVLTFSDWNPETGQVWVPAGIMLAYYSEVRMWYLAGWTHANIPPAIKQAVANVITSQKQSPMSGNTKLLKAGDTTIERFMDTVLDADTRLMLEPYRTRNFA